MNKEQFFIIGWSGENYKCVFTQFDTMQQAADSDSDDWVVIPAKTFDEAVSNYEKYFQMWHKDPHNYLTSIGYKANP